MEGDILITLQKSVAILLDSLQGWTMHKQILRKYRTIFIQCNISSWDYSWNIF